MFVPPGGANQRSTSKAWPTQQTTRQSKCDLKSPDLVKLMNCERMDACNVTPTSMASTWDNRGVGPKGLGPSEIMYTYIIYTFTYMNKCMHTCVYMQTGGA